MVGFRFNTNLSAQALDRLADDGQADAGAHVFVWRVDPFEHFKNPFLVTRVDSNAVVFDPEANEFAFQSCGKDGVCFSFSNRNSPEQKTICAPQVAEINSKVRSPNNHPRHRDTELQRRDVECEIIPKWNSKLRASVAGQQFTPDSQAFTTSHPEFLPRPATTRARSVKLSV
jgi:hypothetical protein